jgi:hypothetical protein
MSSAPFCRILPGMDERCVLFFPPSHHFTIKKTRGFLKQALSLFSTRKQNLASTGSITTPDKVS